MGVEQTLSSPEIRQKGLETINKKYNCNVENVSQIQEIKDKKAKTFYKNGSIPTSRQQLYLHDLIGGELNFPIGYYNLDIAFPDDKIYIEFDGGHNLQVKLGNITEKDFKTKEIIRYKYLKFLGWKKFKIVSEYSYLPSDEVIINQLNNAKEWFKSDEFGHWHYNILLGNKISDDCYGQLREITEKDLLLKKIV